MIDFDAEKTSADFVREYALDHYYIQSHSLLDNAKTTACKSNIQYETGLQLGKYLNRNTVNIISKGHIFCLYISKHNINMMITISIHHV